jgi:PAS domain-containing protein
VGKRGRETGEIEVSQDAPPAALAYVPESTTDCIFSLDREWRFSFLNARAEAEIGSSKNLLGKTILDAFPLLADTPFWPAYQEVMATGEPRHVEAFLPGFDSWSGILAGLRKRKSLAGWYVKPRKGR